MRLAYLNRPGVAGVVNDWLRSHKGCAADMPLTTTWEENGLVALRQVLPVACGAVLAIRPASRSVQPRTVGRLLDARYEPYLLAADLAGRGDLSRPVEPDLRRGQHTSAKQVLL